VAQTIMMAATVFLLRVTTELLEKKSIRRDHQNVFRMIGEVALSFCLSIWPPILVAGLGHLFGDERVTITTGIFFAWWAWLFLGMYVFISVISVLLRTLGETGGMVVHAFLMIIMLVSSSAVEPVDFMNPFFRIGQGLPLGSSLQGSRTIVFGSYDRLGRNGKPSFSRGCPRVLPLTRIPPHAQSGC